MKGNPKTIRYKGHNYKLEIQLQTKDNPKIPTPIFLLLGTSPQSLV